ncbi:hypothetical protein [Caldifermentibacillus hisashii]|uniref:hypothetical protein n=1 Tax=Caldifermentibacillus hisashii TaxID=996558 RepID=UPI003101581D
MNDILKIIFTSTVVSAGINILWKYYESQKSFKNAKYMQITNYYRESSGKDMHKILESWTQMLFLLDKPEVKKKMESQTYISKLINDTYLYSSPETCKRLANYQQFFYNEKEISGDTDDKFEVLVLVAGIIVSLKHDFTGDWVSIEDTLKVKLKDMQNVESSIDKIIKKLEYDVQ